jgi:hypothetical protein
VESTYVVTPVGVVPICVYVPVVPVLRSTLKKAVPFALSVHVAVSCAAYAVAAPMASGRSALGATTKVRTEIGRTAALRVRTRARRPDTQMVAPTEILPQCQSA